jgi:hypothetical protein
LISSFTPFENNYSGIKTLSGGATLMVLPDGALVAGTVPVIGISTLVGPWET